MPSLFSDALRRHIPLSPPHSYPAYQGSLVIRPQHLLLPVAQDPIPPHQHVDPDLLDQCSRLSIDVSRLSTSTCEIEHPLASRCHNPHLHVDSCVTTKALPRPDTQPQTLLEESRQSFHHPHNNDTRRQEEKSTGGVAAHLDYDMQQMVDFVAEMVQGMYALYESGICLADIDITRSVNSRSLVLPAFRKYVLQLLASTRLPRTTILLGMYYLATRMTMMSASDKCSDDNGQMYQMLVTSLLLGSKFLDDNTLKNCSWSEVSNIPTVELNLLEIEWLSAIDWDMHISPDDSQGFALWQKHWNCWQAGNITGRTETLQHASRSLETPAQCSIYNHLSSVVPCTTFHNDKRFARQSKDNHGPQWLMSRPDQVPLPHPRSDNFLLSVSATSPNPLEWYTNMGRHVCLGSRPPYITRSGPIHISGVSKPAIPSNYYHQYVLQYNLNGWESSGIHCSCHYCIAHCDPFPLVPLLQPQSVAS